MLAKTNYPVENKNRGFGIHRALMVGILMSSPAFLFAQATNTWTNVTPSGLNLSGGSDNFGVQDVVVDPVRPTDCYITTCYQGVWKSTDCGATWHGPINNKSGASALNGKQWTAAIDNNPNRDPSTPPTLWTANGNGAMGVLRSTDGGVNWTAYSTHNQTAAAGNNYYAEDVYAIDIDPFNNKHLIVGFHGVPGISESTDGGVTWHDMPVPSGFGGSIYPFFINTGDAATTATTWYCESDDDGTGSWVTANSGSSWKHFGWGHPHGSAQLFNAGNGVALVGGNQGVFKTSDRGQTWTNVYNKCNGVIGTPNTLYASFSFPGGNWDPIMSRAPRIPGTAWTKMSTPSSMIDGMKRASVAFDGTHYIVVAACWYAGIFRFIEAPSTIVDLHVDTQKCPASAVNVFVSTNSRFIVHSNGGRNTTAMNLFDITGRLIYEAAGSNQEVKLDKIGIGRQMTIAR